MISFTAPVIRFTPDPFPIRGRFLIAPFWADVDTRGIGKIYFKETTDDDLLNKANDVIQDATLQAAGLSRFKPSWMLIATWYKVGYFSSHTDQVGIWLAICSYINIYVAIMCTVYGIYIYFIITNIVDKQEKWQLLKLKVTLYYM